MLITLYRLIKLYNIDIKLDWIDISYYEKKLNKNKLNRKVKTRQVFRYFWQFFSPSTRDQSRAWGICEINLFKNN